MLSPNKQPLCPSVEGVGEGDSGGRGTRRRCAPVFHRTDPPGTWAFLEAGPMPTQGPPRKWAVTIRPPQGSPSCHALRHQRLLSLRDLPRKPPKNGAVFCDVDGLPVPDHRGRIAFSRVPRTRGNCWTFGTLGPMVGRVASPPHTPESEHV